MEVEKRIEILLKIIEEIGGQADLIEALAKDYDTMLLSDKIIILRKKKGKIKYKHIL